MEGLLFIRRGWLAGRQAGRQAGIQSSGQATKKKQESVLKKRNLQTYIHTCVKKYSRSDKKAGRLNCVRTCVRSLECLTWDGLGVAAIRAPTVR
jgi:hypothetical protein